MDAYLEASILAWASSVVAEEVSPITKVRSRVVLIGKLPSGRLGYGTTRCSPLRLIRELGQSKTMDDVKAGRILAVGAEEKLATHLQEAEETGAFGHRQAVEPYFARIAERRLSANNSTTSLRTNLKPRDILAAHAMLMSGNKEILAKSSPTRERLANTLMRPSGFPELAAMALRLEHREVPHDRIEMLKAAFSTTSLRVALGTSIQKTALQVFLDQSSNWRSVARIIPAQTF